MKLFIDTVDLSEIRDLNATGLIDGVTTNPSLIAKSARPIFEVIAEICDVVAGPVSVEVTAKDHEGMMREGRYLLGIANNITIKVPLTIDGLKTCRALADDGVAVNVTLCFSPAQALLAAKAGAAFISPFVGRMEDIGAEGMVMIKAIIDIYNAYNFDTKILVASVRGPHHVVEAAKMGADISTLPPAVLRAMYKHPLTDNGLERFMADWANTGQSILSSKKDINDHKI
ncbi:transaldolase, putative [Candidatus Endolissoclinum faulkneri L2]|uniref:Probable transaldolase n=1 Tax=Candidatus Endolissoclinum faulkneri L2 TaxID=1193729 RepID=K7YQ18_9PROT|nr:fructose-6-phosphate aldolase [Candidatus Endolissoclinum faulkneri]AFX99652.1 transaldolase, putative [Candidatus Endolissoclinum faulkneri L2]